MGLEPTLGFWCGCRRRGSPGAGHLGGGEARACDGDGYRGAGEGRNALLRTIFVPGATLGGDGVTHELVHREWVRGVTSPLQVASSSCCEGPLVMERMGVKVAAMAHSMRRRRTGLLGVIGKSRENRRRVGGSERCRLANHHWFELIGAAGVGYRCVRGRRRNVERRVFDVGGPKEVLHSRWWWSL